MFASCEQGLEQFRRRRQVEAIPLPLAWRCGHTVDQESAAYAAIPRNGKGFEQRRLAAPVGGDKPNNPSQEASELSRRMIRGPLRTQRLSSSIIRTSFGQAMPVPSVVPGLQGNAHKACRCRHARKDCRAALDRRLWKRGDIKCNRIGHLSDDLVKPEVGGGKP